MKFFRYITYLFYSYYSKGPRRNVAYFSSILGVTFLIYIQLLLFAVILKIDHYFPFGHEKTKIIGYIKLMLLMSPVFFLLYFGVKEKKVNELKVKLGYEHFEKEFYHRMFLFTYLFLSIATLMVLAIISKH